MKKIITFIIAAIAVMSVSAQTYIEPPINSKPGAMNGQKKPGIQADKSMSDGSRVVYCNTYKVSLKKINEVNVAYQSQIDPIAVNKDGKIYYGFSIYHKFSNPIGIPDNGKVLIKLADNTVINAETLYGCEPETHKANVVDMFGKPMTEDQSYVFCHVIMSEDDYKKIANGELVKFRIETDNSQVDFDGIKGKKVCKYMQDCFPILAEAISQGTSGFDNGF